MSFLQQNEHLETIHRTQYYNTKIIIEPIVISKSLNLVYYYEKQLLIIISST